MATLPTRNVLEVTSGNNDIMCDERLCRVLRLHENRLIHVGELYGSGLIKPRGKTQAF